MQNVELLSKTRFESESPFTVDRKTNVDGSFGNDPIPRDSIRF